MSTEMDRFFEQLQEQGRVLKTQGEVLATMAQSQKDTHERLFGNGSLQGSIPYLHAEVTKHSKQINFWRGAIAVLTVLWAGAVAYATAVVGHHK
jgi:uncharacterized membrane protein